MDGLEKCRQRSLALEKKLHDSKTRWQIFTASQLNFTSVVKLNGKALPPPVMTTEKRKKMQMYRKQAYITEIRLKSHSKEKDFFSKIQVALDEVRDFHIDSSESSEVEVTGSKTLPTVSSVPSGEKRVTSGEKHLLSTCPELPPLASSTKPHESHKLLTLRLKAKSTTDLSRIESTGPGVDIMAKPVARIHRKRCVSEGKSRGEGRSKPPISSASPSHSHKPPSKSNLLAVPFEQYQQQVEEMELSRARRRYRDSRNRAVRSPSPQLSAQNERQSLPARPASTPAIFSSEAPVKIMDEEKNQPTVSSHAMKLLLDSLDPSHDQPTHLWLSSRVSEQGKDNQEDISLDAWFQNAPDSVKQKLVSLLPRLSPKRTDDRKVMNKSVHISPVQTCNSSDDTLRSTSPLSEEDATLSSQPIMEYSVNHITSDDLPLVVIEKSPSTSPRNSPNDTNGTDSKSAADPSGTSIDTVIEVDISSKANQPEPVVPPLELSSLESPMSSTFVEPEPVVSLSPSKHTKSDQGVSERKRSLSMQSYTLEEPSEALLNSTLNDRRDCCGDTADESSSPSGAGNSTKSTKYGVNRSKVDGKMSKRSPKTGNDGEDNPKMKTKIPTLNEGDTLLSKCQLDTPPSPRNNGRVINSGTPVGTARHRQLIKLLSLKSSDRRSLTPTPPTRELTPTPPRRPRSEMGTQSSSSKRGNTTSSTNRPPRSNSQSLRQGRKPESDDSVRKLRDNSNVRRASSSTLPTMEKAPGLTPNRNEKRQVEVDKDSLLESPLKAYMNKEERISRARKQLALLKMKVSARARSMNSETSRPQSSVEPDTSADAKRPMSSLKINEGIDSRRSKSAMEVQELSASHSKESGSHSQNKMAHRLVDSDSHIRGKENMSVQVKNSKTSKKLDKERERPINTAYSANLGADSFSESRFRTNGISSRSAKNLTSDHKLPEDAVKTGGSLNDKKLHGLIKGHLCRKLFKCSKVKSLVKTIQDCRSLLPSIASVNRNSPARDANFQQRIKLQMSAAKEDLHDIFFNIETYQRLALVKQSDKLLACQRGRQARKKHQGASKWKVKEVTKKCQQQISATSIRSSKVNANPPSQITAVF